MNAAGPETLAALHHNDDAYKYRILSMPLMPCLLCSRTASSPRLYATELTAPQLSDRRVAPGRGAENAG